MPLFLKHQTPQFEVVSQLDRELDELILQKQQLGLTLEKLAELEQKIEQANARLAAAILPPNKAPERRGAPPKLPPPPLPKSIDYSLSSSGLTEVPRLFIVRMSDLRPLDTELRKERFKQTILPLILRANEDIARQRKAVIQGIEAEDNDLLRSFAQRYRMPASLIDKKAGQMNCFAGSLLFQYRLRLRKLRLNQDGANLDLPWKETPFLVSGSGMMNWA